MKAGSLFVVMGVSGSGKTTMARLLAEATGGGWLDADDFHPAANKAKMQAGSPLTDEDRWTWLDVLNVELRARDGQGRPFYLACSALKQAYRDRLAAGTSALGIVYLKGSYEVLSARLAARRNHFMPASLLRSQLDTLEEPRDAIVLDISRTEAQMIDDFLARIRASSV